jgi:putative lipoprotein
MKALVLILALHAPPDRWFAPDKLKHFFMAAFVQSVSFSALRTLHVDHDAALVGASAVTLSLGVGKELYDHRVKGEFSVRDLTWDAAGAGAASLLLSRAR